MPKWTQEIIGQRVVELRTERGWSQAGLAAECARAGNDRLSVYTIGQIERGSRSIVGINDLLALAIALRVSPLELVTWRDEDIQISDTVTLGSAEMRKWFCSSTLPAAS